MGDIPAIYRGMSENLGRMTYSDIRDAGDPSPYLAVLRRRSNADGDFTVFGQGELMSQSALILQRDGVIEICDDGPGVPEAERERIFEPFYRLKPRDRGAGLGLNLVLQIARRPGARMTVLSSPSGGACFRMNFGSEAAE